MLYNLYLKEKMVTLFRLRLFYLAAVNFTLFMTLKKRLLFVSSSPALISVLLLIFNTLLLLLYFFSFCSLMNREMKFYLK